MGVQQSNEGTDRARYWFLRACLMLLGVSPLLVLECFLRMFGPLPSVAYDPFLDYSRVTPLFKLDTDNHYRIPEERFRLFSPAQFPANKSAGTRRIFCVGGSTTQGEPYRPETAFPRWMEINLGLAAPSYQWEVINCGGLSYASYRMLPIVDEVLGYEPDLIIVDCGHNEFLESRELSGWKQAPSILVQTLSVLRQSRLIQTIRDRFLSHTFTTTGEACQTPLAKEVEALLDDRGGLERYRRADLDAAAVVASMGWNVTAMVEACQRRDVPMILLVPTANVRDCPPFKVELSPSLGESERAQLTKLWDEKHRHGQTSEETRHQLELVLQFDPEHAGALYVLGKIDLEAERFEAARANLLKARDYDVCPLRATSAIQATIRDVAAGYDVWALDIDALIGSHSDQGLVGDRWLIDHVHPRVEGHQMIGERLTEILVDHQWIAVEQDDWKQRRPIDYAKHLETLGEAYFARATQRLEGLKLWTQGRARKTLPASIQNP